ncbi:hypothetical protein ACLMJK_004793 [Lecanora helva]
MSVEATTCPISGLYQPQTHLKNLFYGPSCVQNHLLDVLPAPGTSRAFIITTRSLATKTPLIATLETILSSAGHHGGTFSTISQHGPVAEVDEATELVAKNADIDTIISVGGGSPIDAAKTISYRMNERRGKFLCHITIPTTLSAAECTPGGGYTKSDGTKTGFMAPEMGVSAIFYDSTFARYTPRRLWVATGMRAVDHAVETMYHPYATEMPWKAMATWAFGTLVDGLPKVREDGSEEEDDLRTRLMLAAFASSGFRGRNFKGGMGLSHSLGYALGSPYTIPHGETSCLTLGEVVKLKAKSRKDAQQIARLLPSIGGEQSNDVLADGQEVGNRINDLVIALGLRQTLTERSVGKDQIPTIVARSTGGAAGGPLYDEVTNLVEALF